MQLNLDELLEIEWSNGLQLYFLPLFSLLTPLGENFN